MTKREWAMANDRRYELILRKIDGVISDAEARELGELLQLADARFSLEPEIAELKKLKARLEGCEPCP